MHSRKLARSKKKSPASGKKRLAAILILLSLVATAGALAYRAALSSSQGESTQVGVQSLTPSTPSREYYHAGGRLVALEEKVSASCSYSISPTSQSFAASSTSGSSQSGTINVTAGAGCSWSAVSNASWITITGGSSGSGNGTVNYSVAVNTATTNRSGTITAAGLTFTVLQGAAFLDVPLSHPFFDYIGKLSARGVTVGCGGGNYCPDSSVNHGQMAAFVMRAKGEFNPPTPTSQRFLDVPPGHTFYNFIERMGALSIWPGCGGGNYCPDSLVTREQMAPIMVRGIEEFNPPTPGSQRFDDVPPTHQYYNFIDRMAVLGITNGCSASPPLYCPTNNVTRGQMAAFLVRAFKL